MKYYRDETGRYFTADSINNYNQAQDRVHISYVYSRIARSNDSLHHPERDLSKAIDMSEEFLYNSSSGHDLESSFKYAFDVTKMRSERILHAPLEEIGSESRNGFCITGTTQVCRKVIVKCSVLKFEGKWTRTTVPSISQPIGRCKGEYMC